MGQSRLTEKPSAARWGRVACALGALVLPLAVSGCTATAGVRGGVVYDYPVYEVHTVPVAIETYPRVYYRDSYAYLVDGRWYYRRPAGGAWVVFREEPRELSRYRVEYQGRYNAPPARRPASPGYGYPAPPRRR